MGNVPNRPLHTEITSGKLTYCVVFTSSEPKPCEDVTLEFSEGNFTLRLYTTETPLRIEFISTSHTGTLTLTRRDRTEYIVPISGVLPSRSWEQFKTEFLTHPIECFEVNMPIALHFAVDVIRKPHLVPPVHMKQFALSSLFADCHIRTAEDDTVPAHRVILAMMSDRFAKELEEKRETKELIVAFPTHCVRNFLGAMYGHSIKVRDVNDILDLITIADQYQVPRLVEWGYQLLPGYVKGSTLKKMMEWTQAYSNKMVAQRVTDIIRTYVASHQDECFGLLMTENPK